MLPGQKIACPKCSHENEYGERFCSNCHSELPNPYKLPYALNPRILAGTWLWDRLPLRKHWLTAVIFVGVMVVLGDWSFVANWGRNGRWEVSSSGDLPKYQDESKVPSGDDLVLRDSAHGWRLISSLPKVPKWVSLRDTDKVQIGMPQKEAVALLGEPRDKKSGIGEHSVWLYRFYPGDRGSYMVNFSETGVVRSHRYVSEEEISRGNFP